MSFFGSIKFVLKVNFDEFLVWFLTCPNDNFPSHTQNGHYFPLNKIQHRISPDLLCNSEISRVELCHPIKRRRVVSHSDHWWTHPKPSRLPSPFPRTTVWTHPFLDHCLRFDLCLRIIKLHSKLIINHFLCKFYCRLYN